jgi:hypothetical protein
MYLFGQVLIPFVSHPITQWTTRVVVGSNPGHLWQVAGGVWLFGYIALSVKGIYVSLYHQLTLALFMALVGDQILYLIPSIHNANIPRRVLYFEAAALFGIQWFAAAALLVLFHFLPERAARLLKFAATLVRFVGAIFQCRMFSRLPVFVKRADERLLLIASLVLCQWAPIIDYVAKKLVRKRATPAVAQFPVIVRVCLAAAFTFALSRHSVISQIFGLYPFEFAMPFLIIAHIYLYLSA